MDDIECMGVADEVTDYLEKALESDEMSRVAAHLKVCWACVNFVGEMQVTTRLAAALPAEPMPERMEESLVSVFRRWSAGVGP